jgi:hypothetical protein
VIGLALSDPLFSNYLILLLFLQGR